MVRYRCCRSVGVLAIATLVAVLVSGAPAGFCSTMSLGGVLTTLPGALTGMWGWQAVRMVNEGYF